MTSPNDSSPPTNDHPTPDLPRCRCGTTREDPRSSPEREYSMMGTLYLLWGGTSVPRRVNFRCTKCGDIFDSTTERALLRRYTL